MDASGRFESAIGPIVWTADAETLRIDMAGRTHVVQWAAASGAGTVRLPQGSAPNAPVGDHLVLAPGAGANYLLRIPLPAERAASEDLRPRDSNANANADAEAEAEADALAAQALVAAVAQGLGDRWRGTLAADEYRRALMPAWSALPDWALPALVLGFVGLSALFLMVVLLLSLGGGGVEISWWQVILGFAIWLGVVAAMLSLYKRLWIK